SRSSAASSAAPAGLASASHTAPSPRKRTKRMMALRWQHSRRYSRGPWRRRLPAKRHLILDDLPWDREGEVRRFSAGPKKGDGHVNLLTSCEANPASGTVS